MIKAKLRELRRLDATKDMVKKAKCKYTYKREVYDWNNGEFERVKKDSRYRFYARCKKYENIMKVALYDADDLIKAKISPEYEVFIDISNKQYTSRVLDKKGVEKSWSTAMINNLPDFYIPWNERVYMDKASQDIVKQILKVEKSDNWFGEIYQYQKKIKSAKREEAIKRQTDKWDAEMSVISELPSDWDEWCKDKIAETYLFYKAGTKEITCCMCGETTHVPERKNNMDFECPSCYRKGIIYATGRIPRYLSTRTEFCNIIQEIPNGYVVRKFGVHMSIEKKNYAKPKIIKHESSRFVCKNGKGTIYNYELYKNGENRWCEDKYASERYPWYSVMKGYFTYTSNLKELLKTVLKTSAIPIFVRNHKGRCDVYSYARLENSFPWIEIVYKAGLIKVAGELMSEYRREQYVDGKQTEVAKILKIDKGLLRRLRENKGGIKYLKYLQLEYSSGKHYDDSLIQEFNRKGIDPEDIEFITDRMAPRAILNYISKQSELSKDTYCRTLSTWRDYLNMAEKAKMQVKTEQIYKPKSLTAAHAMVISILESEKIEKQIKEIKKKWKNVEKNCQELTKYEYSDDKFAIIAPKGIKDIFIEGMTLSHCIHTCDFYFDRINRKESFLLFLRKVKTPETSWYTLEVEPSGNVRQKSTVGDNLNKDFDEAIPFIKKWQKQLKSKLTENDKSLAQKSEELRIENYANLRKNRNKIWHGVLQGKLLVDVLEDRFMAAE